MVYGCISCRPREPSRISRTCAIPSPGSMWDSFKPVLRASRNQRVWSRWAPFFTSRCGSSAAIQSRLRCCAIFHMPGCRSVNRRFGLRWRSSLRIRLGAGPSRLCSLLMGWSMRSKVENTRVRQNSPALDFPVNVRGSPQPLTTRRKNVRSLRDVDSHSGLLRRRGPGRLLCLLA